MQVIFSCIMFQASVRSCVGYSLYNKQDKEISQCINEWHVIEVKSSALGIVYVNNDEE